MGVWGFLVGLVSKRRPLRSAGALLRVCAPAIEQLEPRGGVRAGPAGRLVVEPLECRVLMSVFTAEVSANQAASFGSSYTIDLYTTGGAASQWVINWGDATANTTLRAVDYPGGVFPVPLPASHTYNSGSPQMTPIAATATPAAGGSNAVATFALSGTYGTGAQFSNSGETLFNPQGNYGTITRDAMVVDNAGASNDPFAHESFVATPYYPSVGASAQFSITCESASGSYDNNWGTDGTLVVPSFGGGSDVPYGIAIDPSAQDLAIVGKCSTGWAVAVVNTALNGLTHGSVKWTTNSNFEAGQANGVEIDQTDGGDHLVAVGTDGTHIVATSMATLDGATQWTGLTNGFQTIALPSHALQAVANSVVEDDDLAGRDEILVIGGTTTYCCSGVEVGSNFTLVSLKDGDGSLNTNFNTSGVVQTNFGSVINHSTCCSAFSTDSLYGLAEWYNGANSTLYVTAAGSSNASGGTTKFALARYNASTGALDTGFGPSANGLAFGPNGTAYSIVIPVNFGGAGTIDLGGTNNGDFEAAQFLGTANGSIAAGSEDASFGNGGVFVTDFGTGTTNSNDVGWSIGTQYDSSGNPIGILVCGTSLQSGQSKGEIALADYLMNNLIALH